MKSFKNKTIILAMPKDVGLYACIIDNLTFLGFTTYLISFDEEFQYKNFIERITNSFRRTFFKDKTYKQELKRKYYTASLLKKLENCPKVDYSLTIRVDLFDKEVLNKITALSSKSYAYQWDGVKRHNVSEEIIPLFCRFYVFDKTDLNLKYKTYLTTNFYFDCYEKSTAEPLYDFFFIGSYDSRINKLLSICEVLNAKGYKLNINLRTNGSRKKQLKKYNYINCRSTNLSYSENIKLVSNSKYLIDIHQENIHIGLSFRIFDSIFYEKKIITTNPIIKNFDFYHPNNILLISDLSNIDEFISAPYVDLPKEIKEKYSFSNWIKYILEIEGNI